MDIVSIVVSSISIVAALAAARYARSSANASDRSADAAQRSAGVAERAEARQTERNDVIWSPRLDKGERTQWVIRNTGLDAALDVSISATIAGKEMRIDSDQVTSGDEIAFDITEIRKTLYDTNRQTVRDLANSGVAYFPSYSIDTAARIVWRTPAGTWRVTVLEPASVSL